MSSSHILISVIVVTYRRHSVLCDTLRLLAKHVMASEGEILVIDQCPDSALPEDVLAIPNLRYVSLDEPGMVPARNVGIRLAKGEIVLFVDDDVEPLPGLIQGHLYAYQDPTIGGVAGRILDPGQNMVPSVDSRVFDPERGWEFARFDHTTSGDVMTSRGCNMSFRRDLLVKLGGFDENIEIFRDDTDMCLRVRAAGFRVRFVPEATLIHLDAPSGGTRGTATEARAYWDKELRSYRQFYRHYRDNLYFMLTHFSGRYLAWQLANAYSSYVGISRWPWRLVAKNSIFFSAFWRALHLRRYRKANPSALTVPHSGQNGCISRIRSCGLGKERQLA